MVASCRFAARSAEGPMRINVQIDGDGLRRLKDLAEYQLPDARRRMVERGMEATLESTIQLNPVETGRSRAAWKAALDELRGGSTQSVASEGPVAEGFGKGSLQHQHDEATTSLSAT